MILSSLRIALLEALPCHIAALDTSGRIVLVNRAWRQFGLDNGLPALDWTTVNYMQVCRRASCADAETTLAGFETLLTGRSTQFVLEYPCHVPNGEQRWFELLATLFEADSNRYILTQHRAVTERQLLKLELDQAQKLEAIGRLASGVAHDFNNLLMGIAGAANIGLKKTEPDSPLRYYFDEIKNAAVGGVTITKQLLAFSRKSVASQSHQQIDEIVLGCEGMLRQLIGESIEFEIHAGCPGVVVPCADGQIVQILMNLVVNARDAMAGAGVVTIATSPIEVEDTSVLKLEPGSYCRLRVSDTGAGMDVETQRRIFEPFFTTKGVGVGTGLGLSSVYGIVRSAGGLIRVLSTLGEGTTFEIYLPCATREADVATAGVEPALGGGETVLVVEDEALVRETVREYLCDAGYRVVVAFDGDEARRACRRLDGAIDLLLTDMILPGTSGAEVAREIRWLAPGVAVLFMSAHPREMLLDSGRVDVDDIVLHKPFEEQVLLRAVRDALAARPTPARAACGPVLVVDDDDMCRSALVELFEEVGHTVLEAASGEQALRLASEDGVEIGVVVTDFKLPDFNGVELVARLAERGLTPPVVYLSGRSANDPKIAAALTRPRTKFVQKPAEFDDVMAAVDALMASGTAPGTAGGSEPPGGC